MGRIAFHLYKDPSLLAILLGNVLTVVMACSREWSLGEILWIFWAQSIVIGIMNFVRMITLREFCVKGVKMNDRPVTETQATKYSMALFFLFHYGFFHLVYAMFLTDMWPLHVQAGVDTVLLGVCIAGFLAGHFYSFLYNRTRDFKDVKPNIGTVMFYPYLRVIPMHMTIIFGSLLVTEMSGDPHATLADGTPDIHLWVLVLFMGMKTVCDAGMHAIEHHKFQSPQANAA